MLFRSKYLKARGVKLLLFMVVVLSGSLIFKIVIFGQIYGFSFIITSLFVGSVILLTSNFKGNERANKAFSFLGSRSYSLYAVHFPILIMVTQGFPKLGEVAPLVYVFCLVLVIILATEVTYRFVELPSLIYSRRIRNS